MNLYTIHLPRCSSFLHLCFKVKTQHFLYVHNTKYQF